MPDGIPEQTDKADEQAALYGRLIDSLAMVVRNTVENNWLSYSDEHDTVAAAFANIESALATGQVVTLARIGNEIRVNQSQIRSDSPQLKSLVTILTRRDINNITFEPGFTMPGFQEFIEVFRVLPEELAMLGGFASALEHIGLPGVRSQRVVFKQVAEDQMVVDREAGDLARRLLVDEKNQEAFVEFLKGKADHPDVEQPTVKAVAAHPQALGELIVQAADASAAPADEAAPSPPRIVDAMRRAYDGLSEDPALKTQKGKKELTTALGSLERAIVGRLEAGGQPIDGGEREAIREAVEEMTDELTMDALASAYLRQRKTMENNEKRILRFIKRKGLDAVIDGDLRKKLSRGGLSAQQWQSLLARSGADDAHPLTQAELISLRELQDLVVEPSGTPPPEAALGDMLTRVHQDVERLAVRTEQRIEALVAEVQEEEASPDGQKRTKKKQAGITRARLLALLSEIVQELCQPLSVVSCSINMISGGHLGEVSSGQQDMLKLALESSERLEGLIEKLRAVAGNPTELSPDTTIRKSLYA